jgi:cysteine-rich repeat protein
MSIQRRARSVELAVSIGLAILLAAFTPACGDTATVPGPGGADGETTTDLDTALVGMGADVAVGTDGQADADSAGTDAVASDTAAPDAAAADADATAPDGAADETQGPDAATGDVQTQDVTAPDVQTPDAQAPDAPEPDVTQDVAAPDVPPPDAAEPDTVDAGEPDAPAQDAGEADSDTAEADSDVAAADSGTTDATAIDTGPQPCLAAGSAYCSDDDPCTDDGCDVTFGCVHLLNSAGCSDGDACTTGDVCVKGACTPGSAVDCNDGQLCTTDSCVAATGCSHADNTLACNDGSLCTQTDACKGGKCVGSDPVVCSAAGACHVAGMCDGSTGTCSNPNQTNGSACDDGSACTVSDACQGGICGGTTNCDDGNACTAHACGGDAGCVHTPMDGSNCSDGSGCTTGDICSGSTCTGGITCDSNAKCTGSGAGATCACNSGYAGSGWACATTCGDGIKAGSEGCDDGNLASEDGCSYKCAVEGGWTCSGAAKSTCTASSCMQAAHLLDPTNAPSAGNSYVAATWSGACTTAQFSVTSNGITPYTFVAITPNALTAKTQTHSFTRYPTLNAAGTYQASMGVTGVTVNGLSMYAAIEAGPQNYGDPIYNGIVDGCSGHTSPQEYHYHALQMKCLVASALSTATPWLNADPTTAPSSLVGWAADGFPIYGPVACKDAECTTTETVLSGYAKTGDPATHSFKSYTWSAHSGDARYLDECNGRVEPNGAYHYHATPAFPYVPACFKGVPTFKGPYAPASEGMPGTLQ